MVKIFHTRVILSVLASCVLAAVVYALVAETRAFRQAVSAWAVRDLCAHVELAADAIEEPLVTGDFRRMRAFGDECRRSGMRLTVLSTPGGMIYDTCENAHGDHATCPEIVQARASGIGTSFRTSAATGRRFLYAARRMKVGFVRLGLPEEVVMAPVSKTYRPLVLAICGGAAAFLCLFSLAYQALARNRTLARERDQERRRRLEMERAEDFRRTFVADVTHEIKTPLTGILTAVDVLDEAITDTTQKTVFALLRREVDRLNRLVRDVLSLARLERDEAQDSTSRAVTNLCDVVRECADRARLRAGREGVEIALDVPPAPCDVACDAALIGQALDNLVENALRHAQARHVTLALARTGALVTLSVSDDGVGIPESCRERVFERFYRVDAARSRDRGGTGLGLAIVKHIARRHGGDAACRANPPGGTTFEITFPGSGNSNNNISKGTKT